MIVLVVLVGLGGVDSCNICVIMKFIWVLLVCFEFEIVVLILFGV